MKIPAAVIAVAIPAVLALSGCASSGTGPSQAQGQTPVVDVIKGEVAYSDVLRYDYTGDGKRNRIRFWIAFDGQAATGTPGTPGFKPASGSMRYFLRDEDDGTKVMKWRRGLDMEGWPKDAPTPMTDLTFDGKTATFLAFGVRWTVTDGGSDYRRDRVMVNDGFRDSVATKLYAGNVWVGPPK